MKIGGDLLLPKTLSGNLAKLDSTNITNLQKTFIEKHKYKFRKNNNAFKTEEWWLKRESEPNL